jgi:DNA repair protein RecN (Recombination protein N)
MLKALTVKNYTLIDGLSISFDSGFSVITGETGAGKSIIIGALSLILGKRAEAGVLKDKTRKCVIEGEFDISGMRLKEFFDKNDLDFDNTVFLRREILPSGKSRAFINDTPVNLSILKELGSRLIDIHSQHQTLMLADNHFQLEILDSFLNLQKSKEEYKIIFDRFTEIRKELARLTTMEDESKRDEDYLKFQLQEFEGVSLDPDHFRESEERLNLLTHAGEVAQVLAETAAELSESDLNILDKLSYLRDRLNSISDFFHKAGEFAERIESARLELKDIADEAGNLRSETEFNPGELQELEENLDKIYRLQQKHRAATIEELIEIKNGFEERLLNISSLDEKIAELAQQLNETEKELNEKARQLSIKRKNGAPLFATQAGNVLQKLGMKDAVFEIRVEPLSEFTASGKDKISFLFSANKGINPGEISRIASGGELSRLMLTLKSMITEKSLLPTVIFDEIDTGVSGDIAGKVGNIMKKMAEHRQLIVITHLPQIAAKAEAHYKVFKELKDNVTATNIERLNDDARLTEIAAMLSDEKITDAAKNAARELLN